MNLEMQTTKPPELIATILKALHEQLQEKDQLNLPENLVLTARREEIEWVHSEVVCEIVPMQECQDAGKKLLELIWVDSGSRSQDNSIQTVCQGTQDEEARQDSKSVISVVLCTCESVKAFVSIMMSVSWSNKGKSLTLRHNDISRAHFEGTVQRLVYIRLPAEDRLIYGEDKSWQIDQEHV